MTTLKTTLVYEKSTTGAHRYKEINSDGSYTEQPVSALGTIYIRKSVLPRPPARITVTIDAPDEGYGG